MMTTGRGTNNEFKSTENRLVEGFSNDQSLDIEAEVERLSYKQAKSGINESVTSPGIVRSSVNDHYGFYQNQDSVTID